MEHKQHEHGDMTNPKKIRHQTWSYEHVHIYACDTYNMHQNS